MRHSLAILLLAPVVLSAGAQDSPSRSFVSGVDVRVVNVDVMVTDGDGNPVTDLRPEDFVLEEDGAGQAITNFYRIVNGAARLDEAQLGAGITPEDERFRRRIVLVVDNNFLDPVMRRRALEDVRDFVGERFGGSAEWAVAALGDDLQYLLPFTREPYQVMAALDSIEKLPTYAERHRLDRSLTNDPIRQQYMQDDSGRRVTLDMGTRLRFSSREQAMRNLQSFSVMASSLAKLMRSYGSFGGRKAIVLVTGPMEVHPEFQYLVSQDPRTTSDIGLTDITQSDPGLAAARRELEGTLDALAQAANASGFQIYTLAAAGLRNPVRLHDVTNRQIGLVKDIGSFAAPAEVSDTDTAPRMLTQGTGGMALRSNALGDDLVKVVDDTASYYSLGYQPEHAPDGEFHSISVKVARRGVKVRHRQGYLDLTESDKLAAELATPLSYPKPKGDIPVELTVEETGGEGEKTGLLAHVSTPVSALTLLPPPSGGGLQGDVEVFLAVYDDAGENVTVVQRTFPLSVPAGQEDAARAGAFRPTLRFQLEPGLYTVTVTVRDPVIREHGTAMRNVKVGRS